MKIKIQWWKAFLAACLSVFLLCGFSAESILANERYLYDTFPMIYALYDPDTGLDHYYYTDNILARKMKSWEITTDAFDLNDSGYLDEVHLTTDRRWIYSLITVEDSSGQSKTRLARTFTKGLTNNPAKNSKKTEVLDIDINSPKEEHYYVNFVNLCDGSFLLICKRPDDYTHVVYRIDDKGPELVGEDLRLWMNDADGSFRFIDANDYAHWINCNSITRKVTIEKAYYGGGRPEIDEFTKDYVIQKKEDGRYCQLYRNGKTRDLGDFFAGKDCHFTPVPDSDNEFYISVGEEVRNSTEDNDSSEYVWIYDDYKMYRDGSIKLLTENMENQDRDRNLCLYNKFDEENQEHRIYYRFDDGEERVLEDLQSSSFYFYRTLDGSMIVIKSGGKKYVYSINNNVMTLERLLGDSSGFLLYYNNLYVYQDHTVGKYVNGQYYSLSYLHDERRYDYFEICKDGYDCFKEVSEGTIEYKLYKDGVLKGTESEYSYIIYPTAFVGKNQYLRLLTQEMGLYLKEIGSENRRMLIPRYVKVIYFFQNDRSSDLYVRKVRAEDFTY